MEANGPQKNKTALIIVALLLAPVLFFSVRSLQNQNKSSEEAQAPAADATAQIQSQGEGAQQNGGATVGNTAVTEASNTSANPSTQTPTSLTPADTAKVPAQPTTPSSVTTTAQKTPNTPATPQTAAGNTNTAAVAVPAPGNGTGTGSVASKSGSSGTNLAAPATGGFFADTINKLKGIVSDKKLADTKGSAAPGAPGQKSGSDNGIGSAAPGLAAVATAPKIEKPAEPSQGCVSLSFRHKKTAGHTDEESCSQHKNLIRTKYTTLTSMCIRVNKTPVAFQPVKGKPGEFIIGPVAGPKAEITARFCFGKTTCNEDCTVQKDDFMDSIGGGEKGKPQHLAQWDEEEGAAAPDPKHPKEKEPDVNAHMTAELQRELDRLDASEGTELFADWIAGNEIPACGTHHAMN